MEGGRGIDASREILSQRKLPYVVAAPLLIQDIAQWERSGVQGLQTVILYSLPELDGAVDPIVLGGLADKDNIVILPERVRRLTNRLKVKYTVLSILRLSLLFYGFYGFPPNVGSVGTAALLNVGESIRSVLLAMHREGYEIGSQEFVSWLSERENSGEVIIRALTYLVEFGSAPTAQLIGKSAAARMAKQWGPLEEYNGVGSSGVGKFSIRGLQIGNTFLGVQPLLGVEGDPMRLLFERDLTPHPQYAAYYTWLQRVHSTDALMHFGMHGTAEWLPGNPLGNTVDSWPDILIADMPHLYLYACNNPSESILAKRRGYATIISHNVPSYSRSGLYNELQQLRSLINDYAVNDPSSPERSGEGRMGDDSLISTIVGVLEKVGLFNDLPFAYDRSEGSTALTLEEVEKYLDKANPQRTEFKAAFNAYIPVLSQYLRRLESQLFSEGLHKLGSTLSTAQIAGYLNAVGVGDDVPPALMNVIAASAAKHESKENILLRVLKNLRSTSGAETLSVSGILCNYNPYLNFYMADTEDTAIDKLPLALLAHETKLVDAIKLAQFQWIKFSSSWSHSEDSAHSSNQLSEIVLQKIEKVLESTESHHLTHQLAQVTDLAIALRDNPAIEMQGLLSGLRGEYVPAAPGGDIIRDGKGVLPTGRNTYALDPYRIPSTLAMLRAPKRQT
ncbi:unnamed protein product [Sphagnum compactum]